MIMAMNEDEDIANPKKVVEKNLNNQDGEYIYTDRFELTICSPAFRRSYCKIALMYSLKKI